MVVDVRLQQQADDQVRKRLGAVELLGQLGLEAVADQKAVCRAGCERGVDPGRIEEVVAKVERLEWQPVESLDFSDDLWILTTIEEASHATAHPVKREQRRYHD